MTTPERLRRRQLIEGVVLILLAIFTVAQATYFTLQDRDQNECFKRRFAELSATAQVRGELTRRETELTESVILVYANAAGALKGNPERQLTPREARELRRELVAALINYKEGVDAIQRDRADHKIPPFPVGTCDDE